MKYYVTLPSGTEHLVELKESASGGLTVSVDGVAMPAEVAGSSGGRSGRGATSVRVAGHSIELWLEGTAPDLGVIADGQRFFAKVESERMRTQAAAKPPLGGEGIIRSPMPGRVLRVLVTEGETVDVGAPVAVVEAMKMENELFSGKAGKVKRVHVAAGATVEGGALLVEIE